MRFCERAASISWSDHVTDIIETMFAMFGALRVREVADAAAILGTSGAPVKASVHGC